MYTCLPMKLVSYIESTIHTILRNYAEVKRRGMFLASLSDFPGCELLFKKHAVNCPPKKLRFYLPYKLEY